MAVKPKKTPLDDKSQIAARLKQGRESLNLTQQQLADKVGISRSAIVHYEQGNVIPGGTELIGLAKALKITPNMILSGREGFFDSQKPQHSLAAREVDQQVQIARLAIYMNVMDPEVSEAVSALIVAMIKKLIPKKDYTAFMEAVDDAASTVAGLSSDIEALMDQKQQAGVFDHLIPKKARKSKKS